MKRVLYAIARNAVFGNIVFGLILVAGIMAVNSMKRELFPDFSLDEITIEVPYPGASPNEVKEGVIAKLEEAVDGMEGIAAYATRSEENGGNVEINVKHGYRTADVLDRVRSRVGAISTFPGGAEKPIITEALHRTEVMKLYVAANAPELRLKELAYRIRDELRLLDGVSQIELFGIRDDEIHIEISEERLRTYGLTLKDVAASITRNNLNLAGGAIRTDGRDVRIRTLGRRTTGKALASVAVMAGTNGSTVPLGRLADIRDGFTDDADTVTVNGRPAVILEIYKTRREDALEISAAVGSYIQNKQSRIPETVKLGIFYDLTDDLRSRIDLLVKNGLLGLCLVLLLLWMFLDLRLSFWAGMGIPVSILGALVVVWSMGGTLNMLSLFGLITVLGIVVDDAILVSEAVYHHLQKGLSPVDAAVEGVLEVGLPVTAAILTTVIAFLPLAFIGDVIGKFLAILPMVVIPCLTISLVECLFLLPTHLAHGLKKKRPSGQPAFPRSPRVEKLLFFHVRVGKWMEAFSERRYLPLLKKALAGRYVLLCGALCLLLLIVGLVLGGVVKFDVLPESGSTLISASVAMHGGTPAEVTRKAVDRVEEALKTLDDGLKPGGGFLIKNRMTVVGRTISEEPEAGRHVGGVQALVDLKSRPEADIKALLLHWEQAAGPVPGVESIVFETRTEGPPGDPIEVWIRGHDIEALNKAAGDIIEELRKIHGVHQIRSDMTSTIDELHFTLKPEARTLGLTHDELARQVRSAFYGKEAVRFHRGRGDVRIKVRYTQKEREKIDTLHNLRITTPKGHQLPLLSVARMTVSKGVDVIKRMDGLRCVTVTAAVDFSKTNPDEIIDDLSGGFLAKLTQKYPGLNLSFEGEEKHMQDALGSLYVGFPLAILAVYIVVATLFQSYVQPFIILLTVPFGIVGGIGGHLLMGYDLSLMSIFGMVALSGIVVNDAIMLIQRMNDNLALGQPFFTAVEQACRRRFRAILLTTISTLAGLAPLIIETSHQAKFIIPMAISISAGLVFATLLTLFLVPCLYAVLSDLRRVFNHLRNIKREEREVLEPVHRQYALTERAESPAEE